MSEALFKTPVRVSRLNTLDQVAGLKDYEKAVEDAIKAAQQAAVDEGLAYWQFSDRETSPNKATFIAKFGKATWSRMCTRSQRRDWRIKK